MNNIKDSWNRILETLKEEYEISDLAFSSWIKPLSIYKIEGSELTLTVPGEQIGVDYVKRKYSLPLKVVIADITGQEMDIHFISLEDTKENTPSDQKNENHFLYTFDTFVVGNNNKFAHAASIAVAESPGKIYNPLFLYGGVGLGKTHLMHAITHSIKKNHPEMKILYVTSQDFTNDLIESIKKGKTDADYTYRFREKYRSTDVLLLDDIQWIIGKDATQEEFFHIFNTLYSAGKQIVISSDRPPKDMTRLEERFRSRFEWGLMADIQSPDYETRVAILRKKMDIEGYYIPNDVIEYIATNIKSNIRELEGSLNKIIAVSNIEKCDITMEMAKKHLSYFITPGEKKKVTPEDIISAAAGYFNISPEDITGTNRSRKIAYPRQISMYLIKSMTDRTLDQIGEIMGGKDHTTVIYGINKIENSLKEDGELGDVIEAIKESLND